MQFREKNVTDEERRILLTTIETIATSINVIEKKAEALEKVLGTVRPDLLEGYEKLWRTAATGSPSSSAQVLQEMRRKLLKNTN